MDKKTIIPIAFLLAILILFLVSAYTNSYAPETKANLSVTFDGPVSLPTFIKNIESKDYFDDYDNETVKWMKSLGNKQVYYGNGTYVIMSTADALKIPVQSVTDVEIEYFFECNVVENHSLVTGEDPRDVVFVKNVNYLGQEIYDIPGGA
ncbi:MAG: hypothetical protein IKV87_08280 [Methanobrevibacter sp.]|nr:hypothetical protein [Methanobrevibacter sp.]